MGTTLMGKEIGRGRRERPTKVGRRGWRARKIAETSDGSGGGAASRGIQEGCRCRRERPTVIHRRSSMSTEDVYSCSGFL